MVGTQTELSAVFALPADSVRVISPYVGGGFGSGLRCWPHTVVAALAAREARRPVKLVLTRKQQYAGTGFRPSYRYRLKLGSNRQGRLAAMAHGIDAETSSYETFTEAVLQPGQMLYSTPSVHQEYRTVPLDVNTPLYMRGPGYATASFVIESAMDELAHKLGIDPIELRRRNEPSRDESKNLPFSTRRLRECYIVGARTFGWDRSNTRPRSRREGDWLIGMGMAAGVYDTARMPAQAHVRLDAEGTAVVDAAASDMGPGTYTSQTQVAADALGLTMRAVTFRLGDSLFPPTPPHGGSMTMASVGSAVLDGCNQVRRQAIKMAVDNAPAACTMRPCGRRRSSTSGSNSAICPNLVGGCSTCRVVSSPQARNGRTTARCTRCTRSSVARPPLPGSCPFRRSSYASCWGTSNG